MTSVWDVSGSLHLFLDYYLSHFDLSTFFATEKNRFQEFRLALLIALLLCTHIGCIRIIVNVFNFNRYTGNSKFL